MPVGPLGDTREKLEGIWGEATYYSLNALRQHVDVGYDLARLPVSLKILLEGLLRHHHTGNVSPETLGAFLEWGNTPTLRPTVPFFPSRVLMQDFTGVPVLVDLAALREAVVARGGDPRTVTPRVPVDLVVDHSVMVDAYGTPQALEANLSLEFQRNHERYQFFKWGQGAFDNLSVIPPGQGICHQVNLEYLAPGICVSPDGLVFPDTVVGTDSHTTRINALGVLGWGVGGIEAESVMLGYGLMLALPPVTTVELVGRLQEGVLATDLILTLTQLLRHHGVVGHFVEFFGEGLSFLTLPDRATVANMAPEFGATCALFPVDEITLAYLRQTGRSPQRVALLEAYAKAQGLWHSLTPPLSPPLCTHTVTLDLGTVRPSMAGPKRPNDRLSLSDVSQTVTHGSAAPQGETQESSRDWLNSGDVVIAAITSCTNTSNPSVMIGAGLLAQKALARGLKAAPWVKTSLAPGSQTVTRYLEVLGLMGPLQKLGFDVVGYGCTTCIGNSGPLTASREDQIRARDLDVAAVLSGNRNFEGRIHPHVKLNYLASAPLVVAYALVGHVRGDVSRDPLGRDAQGQEVFLRDIWPSSQEIAEAIARGLTPDLFPDTYAQAHLGSEAWQALKSSGGQVYAWDPDSTYIAKPPFLDTPLSTSSEGGEILGARIFGIFGDSITTDHISPAGAIAPTSPAGVYLRDRGVSVDDLNAYGARRGNHQVMVRGTFSNPRLKNALTPGMPGGMTRVFPGGEVMSFFEASQRYHETQTPLVIFAGWEYGTGSSRDWAAKGTQLLGVCAVVAQSFERIHRSNLVGMGVLPLSLPDGTLWADFHLQGDESVDILGLEGLAKNAPLTLRLHKSGGEVVCVTVRAEIETEEEVEIYRHGGLLPHMLERLLRA